MAVWRCVHGFLTKCKCRWPLLRKKIFAMFLLPLADVAYCTGKSSV